MTKKKKRKSGVHKKVMSHHHTRKRRRRKTGMSEIMSPQNAKRAAQDTIGGGIGGAVAYAIDAIGAKKLTPLAHTGVMLLSSFISSAVLGAEKVGAGIAGAGGYALLQKVSGGMSEEEHEYTDQEVLNEYPDALDEEGNPMFLADDGEFHYLEEMNDEFQLAAGGIYPGMSAGIYPGMSSSGQARLYPGYVDSSRF